MDTRGITHSWIVLLDHTLGEAGEWLEEFEQVAFLFASRRSSGRADIGPKWVDKSLVVEELAGGITGSFDHDGAS
jgi:hypothetical protein